VLNPLPRSLSGSLFDEALVNVYVRRWDVLDHVRDVARGDGHSLVSAADGECYLQADGHGLAHRQVLVRGVEAGGRDGDVVVVGRHVVEAETPVGVRVDGARVARDRVRDGDGRIRYNSAVRVCDDAGDRTGAAERLHRCGRAGDRQEYDEQDEIERGSKMA
jgi:hypothetical protein